MLQDNVIISKTLLLPEHPATCIPNVQIVIRGRVIKLLLVGETYSGVKLSLLLYRAMCH